MSRFAPLGYTTIPRSSIESFRYASIDLSLKDLRTIAHRVKGFSTPYYNELQLLERIYYKGKNQHRSALFWRKVLEIRRLGTRIGEADISGFVEDLHYTFYAVEDRNNPKVLRGPWSQAPDTTSCISLLRRLRSVCLLVDETRARFRVAHEAFTQQVRTAAFIPLAISLIAIMSRLDFLVSELREILAFLWQAVARILDTIAPDTGRYQHINLPFDPLYLSAMMSSGAGAAKTDHSHKRDKVAAGFIDDFGSRVSRDFRAATAGTHSPEGSSSAVGQTLLTEVESSVTHPDPSRFTEAPTSCRPTSIVPSSTLPRLSSEVPDDAAVLYHIKRIHPSEFHSIPHSPRVSEGCASEQRLVGKKRKVKMVKWKKIPDEIDDIFGF